MIVFHPHLSECAASGEVGILTIWMIYPILIAGLKPDATKSLICNESNDDAIAWNVGYLHGILNGYIARV